MRHYPRVSYTNHLQIVTEQKYRQGRTLDEYYKIMGKCSVTGFVTGLVIDIVYIFDKLRYESYRVTKILSQLEKMLSKLYFRCWNGTYFDATLALECVILHTI